MALVEHRCKHYILRLVLNKIICSAIVVTHLKKSLPFAGVTSNWGRVAIFKLPCESTKGEVVGSVCICGMAESTTQIEPAVECGIQHKNGRVIQDS